MSDLLEDVREATRALSELAAEDGVLWPRMSAALRATCDDVGRRLTSKELSILLVGPPDGGKRTLINTAVGAELLRGEAREASAVVLVRHGDDAHYACELEGGATQSLAGALRTKTRHLDEALSRAEAELAEAEAEIRDLRRRLAELRERTAVTTRSRQPSFLDAILRVARRVGAHVVALVAWLIASARRTKAARSGERTVALEVSAPLDVAPLAKEERFSRILALERALLRAEPRVVEAKRTVAEAREEASKHAAERTRIFLVDLHALTDADLRGGEVVALSIHHPSEILPPGLVLVDAPELTRASEQERDDAWKRIRDDLGGCIVVSPGGRSNVLAPDLVARLGPILPHGVRGLPGRVEGVRRDEAVAELAGRLRAELPVLFARIREESPTLVAAFVTRVVRDRLAILTGACVTSKAEIDAQTAELEQRRTAAAVELRKRMLDRMRPAMDEAAGRVVEQARASLRTRINDLGDEWRDEIAAGEDRAAVDACIERVNASAPERFRAICDGLTEQIVKDVQAAADGLQTSLLAELSAAASAAGSSSGAAPVVLGDTAGLDADGVPSSVREMPLSTTHDAFERKRVGIGLGGAAAGAALGTLIVPGLGTAVGAMIGVLAGFVEGTGSLKRRAIEHLRAHGAVVESEISARLDGAVPGVARDLAASVEETLERAIARRVGSIARLFEETDRAIAREHQKAEELARIRAALGTHEDRFAGLAGRSASSLQALAAAREREGEARARGAGASD